MSTTAFPWLPKTTWQRQDSAEGTVWHVTVTDPSPAPPLLKTIRGQGSSPRAALENLLEVAGWWFDWHGRRGGTVAQTYGRGPA